MLYPIFGKPLIQHVIDKIKKSKKTNIIVSTSNKKNDDKLVVYLKKKKIKYFRGSLNNVAKRLYDTALSEKQKYFLRISADSPLIDFHLINQIINLFEKNKKFDLITNVFPRTFPSGQSVEIIKTSIIARNLKFFSKLDKEHVTRYFYRNYSKFKIKNIKNKKRNFHNKLSIDTINELKMLLNIYSKKKIFKFYLFK